jgi:hypothetical protein
MSTASPSVPIERSDLVQAVAFCQVWFDRWLKQGFISPEQHRAVSDYYTDWRSRIEGGSPIPPNIHLRPQNLCWSCKEMADPQAKACDQCGAPLQNSDATAIRYLIFLCFEVRKQQEAGRINLSAADGCLADANARISTLRRKLDAERVPLEEAAPPAQRRAAGLAEVLQEAAPEEVPLEAIAVDRPRPAPPRPAAPPAPRRNLMEILLDPRTIQWMLACGGALLVLGGIIWLAAEGLFQNPTFVAVLLGAGTLALLAGGWAVCRFTRYELAGRALTLLACLIMPFNVWFYDYQNLITLSNGHLWIPALVCCVLYAASARLLRDPTFVYVFILGVAGTGLLILADQSVARGLLFWEIGAPATLLVVLGLLSIHAERIFPEGEGPFSRRRFGLAFFWAGHAVLGAGLLFLLGAHIAGDWLYTLFEPLYRAYDKVQPEIVTTTSGKLQALALVLAGTYAYFYSDLVVRRLGVYIHLGVVTLLWAEVLLIRLVPIPLPPTEVVILFLSLTGLITNLALSRPAVRDSGFLRAGPALALLLSILPVVLGVILHFRATVQLTSTLKDELTWSYVVTMLVAAVCCRVGAFLYRHTQPSLSVVYFFGTGAATMTGAASLLLVAVGRPSWEFQAPILMVIPLLYLLAARLYRGHTPERPLVWVAHAGTAVMLISSLSVAFIAFGPVAPDRQSLYLTLALFFAEAALFYGFEATWRRHTGSVYACTAAACAAVWQLLKYAQVAEEWYILTFAVVGLALLVIYRFAVLERIHVGKMASAAFQSANALLSLAFVGGALLTLSELVQHYATRSVLLPLLSALVVIALLAVALVRHEGWRRWYVAVAITHAALFVLVLAVLSTLTPAQRLEVACVIIGLLLLVVGHVGWYREQDAQSDLVSFSLGIGSLLVAVPLTIAVVSCRYAREDSTFHTVNEIGMLAAGLVLLAAGFSSQIKSTTLAGGFMMAAYLVTLLLYVRLPEKLQTMAVYIMIGGGVFFAIGLLLSIYRDRLLQLPERVKRREGVFRVLTWR